MWGGYEREAWAPPRVQAIPLASTTSRTGGRQAHVGARPRGSATRRLARERRARAAARPRSPASLPPTRAISSTSSRTYAIPGKLDRELGRLAGVRVLHKAGWINRRAPRQRSRLLAGRRLRGHRDDLPPGGAGISSDVLAGRSRGSALALPRFVRWRSEGRARRGAPRIAVAPSECAAVSAVSGPGRRWFGNRAPVTETRPRHGFVRVP